MRCLMMVPGAAAAAAAGVGGACAVGCQIFSFATLPAGRVLVVVVVVLCGWYIHVD